MTSVADPDPGSSAFLTNNAGWMKNQDPDPESGPEMNIPIIFTRA
jgi:hypothetical protein